MNCPTISITTPITAGSRPRFTAAMPTGRSIATPRTGSFLEPISASTRDRQGSPRHLAPFRAAALVDRDQPGLVVGLVDHLGRQDDFFRQRLAPEMAHRGARRRTADLQQVEVDGRETIMASHHGF